MRTPIFTIDRAGVPVRAELVNIISGHLDNDEIVQVVDSNKPSDERLRFTIQWDGGAGRAFDGHGRGLGVFADLDTLIAHAETATT